MTLAEALTDLDEPQSILKQALWKLDDERHDPRAPQEARTVAEIAHTAVLDAMILVEDALLIIAAAYAIRKTEEERELAEDEAAERFAA